MTCVIEFRNLAGSAMEPALGALLEPVLAEGARVLVRAGSVERVEALNTGLWTYGRDSFLPHGSAKDGQAARQPIWLTVADENPNGASVLVLIDDTECQALDDYDRCLYLFDGQDPVGRDAGRARYRQFRDAGYALSYWQQGRQGWDKTG
jgi:DNA polymerase-3 subunit chi